MSYRMIEETERYWGGGLGFGREYGYGGGEQYPWDEPDYFNMERYADFPFFIDGGIQNEKYKIDT